MAVVAAALPIILYQGREQWFFLDEWDFLAGRDLNSGDDLLRPHNEHWSTLPIVAFRLLFRVVGLHHYWPYQVCVVTLHLAAAVLLRAVMRRSGVDPWIATAAASLFALLGSGRENIELAFQVGFTGSLTLGLAHLLLADHEGRLDGRDAMGLACGLASLMCSGIGVPMTVAIGAALLARRGWRVASVHTVPLGSAFLVWFGLYGHDSFADERASVSQAATFIRTATANTFDQLGQVPGVGIVLGVMLVAGAILVIAGTPMADLRRRYSVTGGLLVGAVLFLGITAFGRGGVELFGSLGAPRSSRYVHLVGAMVLPALAVSASALAQRWRPLLAIALGVFLIGLPGNVDALYPTGAARFTLGGSELILVLPRVPLARQVSRELQPLPFFAPEVTVGWLIDAEAAGRLPDPGPIPRAVRDDAEVALSLSQEGEADRRCRPVPPTEVVKLRAGQTIILPDGSSTLRRFIAGAQRGSAAYWVGGDFGPVVRVENGPIALRLQPATPAARARVCP